jgi:hypothetical protein
VSSQHVPTVPRGWSKSAPITLDSTPQFEIRRHSINSFVVWENEKFLLGHQDDEVASFHSTLARGSLSARELPSIARICTPTLPLFLCRLGWVGCRYSTFSLDSRAASFWD